MLVPEVFEETLLLNMTYYGRSSLLNRHLGTNSIFRPVSRFFKSANVRSLLGGSFRCLRPLVVFADCVQTCQPDRALVFPVLTLAYVCERNSRHLRLRLRVCHDVVDVVR